MNLNGQTVLVTGSNRNIGQSIATTLAEAGADGGITAGNNEEGCIETARQVKETGSDTTVAPGDLAEPTDIEWIVEKIRNELRPIDILISNARVVRRRHFSVEPPELDPVLDVNLKGQFLLTQHVVSGMLEVGLDRSSI